MSNVCQWEGSFSTTSYSPGYVSGSIKVDLPFDLKGPHSSEVKIKYDGVYRNELEFSVPINLENSSENDTKIGDGRIDIVPSFNIKATTSMFVFFTQELNFTSSEINLDEGDRKRKVHEQFSFGCWQFRIEKNLKMSIIIFEIIIKLID
jgi:hypothetical protein